MVLRYSAPSTDGGRLTLGEVAGRVEPARAPSRVGGRSTQLVPSTTSPVLTLRSTRRKFTVEALDGSCGCSVGPVARAAPLADPGPAVVGLPLDLGPQPVGPAVMQAEVVAIGDEAAGGSSVVQAVVARVRC